MRAGPARQIIATLLLAASTGLACSSPEPVFDNVVLVTLDTLRSDHLGCYGYPRPTSPFLDSLAARGVRFENAITASSHTAPSHASIFTSHYPARHRVLHNGVRLRAKVPTLASALSEGGLETAAVTSVGFLKSVSRGFATVLTPGRADYRPADQTVDSAIDWLRARTEVDRFNRYDAQIRLIDGEIARLFDEVGRSAAGTSTLWVITADHGEGLGSHGYLSHDMNLYREQLSVPLIFFGGDALGQGLVVTTLARSVDLFPTIVDLVGLPDSSSEFEWEGRSLRGPLSGEEPGRSEIAFAQRRPFDPKRRNRGWIDELVLVAQTSNAKYVRRSIVLDEAFVDELRALGYID